MSVFDTGGKIRELRIAANLSQEQLAELSSLNRVTIAKYEIGRVEPGAQALSRIADALDVSVDTLLGRSDPAQQITPKPRTPEARIVSGAMDRMPPEDREKALNVLKAVYSDYFDSAEDKIG